MPAYATPARLLGPVSRTRVTQNAVNSRSLRTDDAPRGSNNPSLGWRLVLDPLWRGNGDSEASPGFTFYLFAKAEFRPPSVMRLGKKGCLIRLDWQEISTAVAVVSTKAVHPTHAVNPF